MSRGEYLGMVTQIWYICLPLRSTVTRKSRIQAVVLCLILAIFGSLSDLSEETIIAPCRVSANVHMPGAIAVPGGMAKLTPVFFDRGVRKIFTVYREDTVARWKTSEWLSPPAVEAELTLIRIHSILADM